MAPPRLLLNKLIQCRLVAVSQALFYWFDNCAFILCVPLLVSFVWMLGMRRFLNGYLSSCIRKSCWRKAFEHQLCFVFSSCLLMSILESQFTQALVVSLSGYAQQCYSCNSIVLILKLLPRRSSFVIWYLQSILTRNVCCFFDERC